MIKNLGMGNQQMGLSDFRSDIHGVETIPEVGRKEEGILIHIIRGRSIGTKVWVVSEADLSSLEISEGLREELRYFWNSRKDIFISQQINSRSFASADQPIVIAERLIE